MRVGALVTPSPQMVVDGGLDFSRLPFSGGERDVNADVPYLSDAVSSRPFQNLNFELRAGVHLHWILPAALRSAEHDVDGITYPPVPTRWLVTRTSVGRPSAGWIVESDYLHPEGNEARPWNVSFPLRVSDERAPRQAFRHIGRAVPFDEWRPFDPEAEYLGGLTAVGYGDPTFATFYPACHSVFGFHDPDLPSGPTSYDVIGWYDDPAGDLTRHQRDRLEKDLGRAATAEELRASFTADLRLEIAADPVTGVPDRTLLVGRASVAPADGPTVASGGAAIAAAVDAPDVAATAQSVFPSIVLAPSPMEAIGAGLSTRLLADMGPTDGGPNDRGRSAEELEEQLDYVLLGAAIDSEHVDAAITFGELSHRQGFDLSPAGMLWRMVPVVDANVPADASGARREAPPVDAVAGLDELNALQRSANLLESQQRSIRGQLFADWQRWMQSQYAPDSVEGDTPEPDRIMDLIERRDLAEHAALERELAAVATRIAAAVAHLDPLLQADGYRLEPSADAPFWSPAEPFLLLGGAAVAPTTGLNRPARGDAVACPVLVTSANPARLPGDVEALRARGAWPDAASVDVADPAARLPIMFDWEAEFFEVAAPGPPGRAPYPPNQLSQHYQLTADDVDLTARASPATAAAADIVSGRGILTAGSSRQAMDALERFIWTEVVRDGSWEGTAALPKSERSAFIDEHADAIAARFRGRSGGSTVVSAVASRATLQNTPFLGQVLSGFNAALLMQRQSPQLPVRDPIGFPEHQRFTAEVRDAVGSAGRHTPLGESGLHPLRAGDLSLLRLRLIDSFGRSLDWNRDVDHDAVPFRLSRHYRRHPRVASRVHLPPRFSQPARLVASWLSATDEGVESIDHPATSPICGWFLANHLDDSLMVYRADGELTGSLVGVPDRLDPTLARWIAAPGGGPASAEQPARIDNPHLRAAVERLRALGPDGLSRQVRAFDATLEMIEPHTQEHPELALLMGQPFALARATIDLQLDGRPAIDQSWVALHHAIAAETSAAQPNAAQPNAAQPSEARSTRAIAEVEFEVRLGAFHKLDDGLLAYWTEGDDGPSSLHTPHATARSLDDGTTVMEGSHHATVSLRLADGPSVVSMLFDPRSPVHLTAGVLPVQTMQVAAEHAGAAMAQLATVFLAAPLLTPATRLALPLPVEAGFGWAWVERRGAAWQTFEGSELSTGVPAAHDERQTLRDGWLRLVPESSA